MSIITATPRLIVREFLPEEQAIYLNHFNDEMVLLYIPKRSRDERIGIFRKALEQYAITKHSGIWGIFNKADGGFMGSCLLRPFNNEPGKIELGYSLDRKHWGTGIATEMALAMVEHGFTCPDITEIVAVTELPNIGSQRVLEKAGFTRMDNLLRDGEELAFFRVEKT